MYNIRTYGFAVLLLVLVPVVFVVLWLTWVYGNISAYEEKVFSSWAQVETTYQLRADLLPNLTETVKTYAKHEQDLMLGVADARIEIFKTLAAAAESLNASTKNAEYIISFNRSSPPDETELNKIVESQQAVASKYSQLLLLVENYPNLRAADNFTKLQGQLEGVENRINLARMNFNDNAREFNASIRRFPGILIADLANFRRKAYFEADPGANSAPKITF